MDVFSSLPYMQMQAQQTKETARSVSGHARNIGAYLSAGLKSVEAKEKQNLIYQQALEAADTYRQLLESAKEYAPDEFKKNRIVNLSAQLAKPIRGIDNTDYLLNMRSLINKTVAELTNEIASEGRQMDVAQKMLETVRGFDVSTVSPLEAGLKLGAQTGASQEALAPTVSQYGTERTRVLGEDKERKEQEAISGLQPGAMPSQTYQDARGSGVGHQSAYGMASLQGEEDKLNVFTTRSVSANTLKDVFQLTPAQAQDDANALRKHVFDMYKELNEATSRNDKEYSKKLEREIKTAEKNLATLDEFVKQAPKASEAQYAYEQAAKTVERKDQRSIANDVNGLMASLNGREPIPESIQKEYGSMWPWKWGSGDEKQGIVKLLREQYGVSVMKDPKTGQYVIVGGSSGTKPSKTGKGKTFSFTQGVEG